MDNTYYIGADVLSIAAVQEIISYDKSLALSDKAKANIKKCSAYLDKKETLNSILEKRDEDVVSNGNLLKSHACGTGDEVPIQIVKLMLFLKIQSLCYGYSGVELQTVERLIDFYNNEIIPVVYTQSSKQDSVDLVPLAHLSLPLIGEGKVYFQGKKVLSSLVSKQFDWDPIILKPFESLALLHGTQLLSAYGVYILIKANKYHYLSDLIATISLESFDGRIDSFHELVQFIRPHKGQITTANRIKEFLDGSEIIDKIKSKNEDSYPFNCIPQVHGASKDAIEYVRKVFKTEINAVTENPNIFPESDQIISGGNFHGQPLILGLNFLALALAELGRISERRSNQLNSSLNAATKIVIQNIQLVMPSTIDGVLMSNGQEIFFSSGVNTAVKTLGILQNLEQILAVELINASQIIERHRPLESSDFIEMFLSAYKDEVALGNKDQILLSEIENTVSFLNSFQIEED